ncbi:MAG TPA: hypothetical protein VGO68_04695 [Pyrinomonadaceae bacterium]|jgi:hypothetical protein|nr:hypothetical protein [Pyrinomonadaceae bacterium]
MATESITLEIDAPAAQAFHSAPAELRAKFVVLMEIWLQELFKADGPSLLETMDEISDQARSRGLTAQELETILRQE